MAKRALTATQVDALEKHGVHWIAPSLYMQIRPQGTRSWLFRYGRDGQNQWLGLGSVADKPLRDARDEAAELRARVRRGVDLVADRDEGTSGKKLKVKVPTFAECAERYIEDHRPGWKNDKHIEQWESTIRTYANPVIGKVAVDKITVDHVLKVLKPIWTGKPETASRLKGRIEKILGWATAMKYRSGDNPAAWDGALGHLLPPISRVQRIEHHKAMAYKDVPALMAELMQMDSESAKALAFTILTVARTGETIGAKPQEIDRAQKLWVVPPERMKAGREHRVPLTEAALAVLGDLPGKYVLKRRRGQAALQHGHADAAARPAGRRLHRPRLPFRVLDVGARTDRLPARNCRGLSRPCVRRRGGVGLSPDRLPRQASCAHGGVGAVLRAVN
jgi:integrase